MPGRAHRVLIMLVVTCVLGIGARPALGSSIPLAATHVGPPVAREREPLMLFVPVASKCIHCSPIHVALDVETMSGEIVTLDASASRPIDVVTVTIPRVLVRAPTWYDGGPFLTYSIRVSQERAGREMTIRLPEPPREYYFVLLI